MSQYSDYTRPTVGGDGSSYTTLCGYNGAGSVMAALRPGTVAGRMVVPGYSSIGYDALTHGGAASQGGYFNINGAYATNNGSCEPPWNTRLCGGGCGPGPQEPIWGEPVPDYPVVGQPVDPITGRPVPGKPVTGRPVIDPITGRPVIDPITGRPVVKPITGRPVPGYPIVGQPVDPITGRPVGKPDVGLPVIDPVTGQPVLDDVSGLPVVVKSRHRRQRRRRY